MKRSRSERSIGRREFLKRGMLAGVGVSLMPLASSANASIEASPQVRRYSALGRTGLKISDISFGGSRLTSGNEDLVRHAFDSRNQLFRLGRHLHRRRIRNHDWQRSQGQAG